MTTPDRLPASLPAPASVGGGMLLLCLLGTVAAHIIPLDVTLSQASGQVQARILSPDGQAVSGVRLFYQLADESPQPFREAGVGLYTAAPGASRSSGPVTLLDRTFPQEGSQASVSSNWPPAAPLTLHLPPAPLLAAPAGVTPAVLVAVVIALGFAAACWHWLRSAGRGKSPDTP